MRIARLLFAGSTAVLACAATAGAQGRSDDVARLRAAVEAATARATDAFNRGDIDAYIVAYAPEVWVFPPNAEPFQGRAAANDFFSRGYAEGSRNLQLRTTGLDRSGTIAYETGTYVIEFPTPGQRGATSRDYGKYVNVWKRGANGEWRIHLATWNSNLPMPVPAR
jgi:ketosteroid isomerase-like protein